MLGLRALALTPEANESVDKNRVDQGSMGMTDVASQAARSAQAATDSIVGRTVADVERDLILQTLSHCLGNRTHAANILGISIRTLRNKLKLYTEKGVDVPSPGEARSASA